MRTQTMLVTLAFILSACGTPSTPMQLPTETPLPPPPPTETPLPPTATSEPSPTPAEPADVIFHDGTIITIEETQPLAEAIAFRNGLIQAVGTDADVLTLQGPNTRVIDLQGKTLMPGFVDPHTHVLKDAGLSLEDAQQLALEKNPKEPMPEFTVTETDAWRRAVDAAVRAQEAVASSLTAAPYGSAFFEKAREAVADLILDLGGELAAAEDAALDRGLAQAMP